MTSTFGPTTDVDGFVTSWLPLTTTYTAPVECVSSFFAWGNLSTAPLVAYDPQYGLSGNTELSCLPAVATSWWFQNSSSYTYHSIGPVVCPAQYSTAWTTTLSDPQVEYIACCPTDFTFFGVKDAATTGECTSSVLSGQVLTYAYQSNITSGDIVTQTTTVASNTVVYAVQLNGYLPLSSSTSTLTTASQTAPTANATSAAPTTSHGMPQSTKIAIGVGVALGVVLLTAVLLAAYWLVQYRRRRRQQPRMMHEIYPESEGK